MSKYQEMLDALEEYKCEECNGTGECDNAEPYGMMCDTWVCTKCNGTGLNSNIGNFRIGVVDK